MVNSVTRLELQELSSFSIGLSGLPNGANCACQSSSSQAVYVAPTDLCNQDNFPRAANAATPSMCSGTGATLKALKDHVLVCVDTTTIVTLWNSPSKYCHLPDGTPRIGQGRLVCKPVSPSPPPSPPPYPPASPPPPPYTAQDLSSSAKTAALITPSLQTMAMHANLNNEYLSLINKYAVAVGASYTNLVLEALPSIPSSTTWTKPVTSSFISWASQITSSLNVNTAFFVTMAKSVNHAGGPFTIPTAEPISVLSTQLQAVAIGNPKDWFDYAFDSISINAHNTALLQKRLNDIRYTPQLG
jgi:hypothetical protein